MQTERMRDEQLNVRLNPDEEALFKRVAEHFGLTPAAMVRMLVREKARELGVLTPPPVSAPPPSQPRTKTAKKR